VSVDIAGQADADVPADVAAGRVDADAPAGQADADAPAGQAGVDVDVDVNADVAGVAVGG